MAWPSSKPGDNQEVPFALRFQKLKAEIHRKLIESIDISKLDRWKPERLQREIRGLANQLSQSAAVLLSEVDRERLVKEILDEVFGLGPLEPLMHDPTVSDILVNGPRMVYVERYGRLQPTDIVFADDAHLIQVIQRIAARVGRRADEMSAMLDARLPDGSRVNAILPPLSLEGPVLSIRRFGIRLTWKELLENTTMPPEMLELLRGVVESRVSLLISGGTGSGKTTFLNAMSRFIPNEERLITVEDAAELKLQQPHVIKLETRPANLEGVGEVRQRDLVRNALRMRPDRIIVGEVRGGEALDMLQAMNTGHEGSLTTIHANDTRDALSRLEMMVMLAGFEIPVSVIRHYIASALTLVVHLSRVKGGARRVVRISEIVGLQPAPYAIHDVFGFQQTGVRDGAAVGHFYATGYVPKVLRKLRASGLDLPAALFEKRVLAQVGDAPEPGSEVDLPTDDDNIWGTAEEAAR
jgi:pilus assembly protein CpaF